MFKLIARMLEHLVINV